MAFELLLGEREVPDGYPIKKRVAVRAVIFCGDKILLNRNKRGIYLLPGGGIEPGETLEDGLSREIAEETGYTHIHVSELAGTAVQQAQDLMEESEYFRMESLYFYVDLEDMEKKEPRLDDYEKKQGFTPVFVTLEDAISCNEKRLQGQRELGTIREAIAEQSLIRDTLVLRKLLRIRRRITRLYFVRHAQSLHPWEENRTRPLTEEGMRDREMVRELLRYIDIDYVISSPYIRSVETIRECADDYNLEIHTDERLRERDDAPGCNTREWIQKRWADFNVHEDGGESLSMVQSRNMAAVTELLEKHPGENILIGTHGTALSTILNFYEPDFGGEQFFRLINFMPYMIRLDFEGPLFLNKKELGYIEKEFHANPKPTIEYQEGQERFFDEKRMFTYVTGYANAHGLTQTKSALAFAEQKHKGQFRKGKDKIPYIIHPLNMACHALALGITNDSVIATILLHDVCEDCGVSAEELPVSESVQRAVGYMTFRVSEGETKEQAKERYFRDIAQSKEASITKVIDRCNNISSMTSGFSRERIMRYIDETRRYILPLIKTVKAMYPEYDNQMFLLKYHICSVLSSIENMDRLTKE